MGHRGIHLAPRLYLICVEPTVFWPANANAQNVAKSLRVDEGLADCIRSGGEVLYACDASIAVPVSMKASLRAGLGLL